MKQTTKENIGLWIAIIAGILFILRVFGVI